MIFVKYDLNNEVYYIHMKPFDKNSGLGRLESELLKEGALVESIEEENIIPGFISILKYNNISNKVYREYVKCPENIEDLVLRQGIEIYTLKKQNADFENALVELAGMVGGA